MPTANDVKLSTRDDLRATYLLAFSAFATDPAEVAEHIGGNTRYGRELLGTLSSANLLTMTEDGDHGDVWQVVDPGTYDDHTEEEAIAVIDAWLDKHIPIKATPASSTDQKGKKMTTTATKTKATPKSATLSACLCGCGGQTKSNYLPGHDARHAGAVARQIAATPAKRATLIATLPSEPLKVKAGAMADRLTAKAQSKEVRVEKIKTDAKAANETATSTAKPKAPAKPVPAKPVPAKTTAKKA